MSKTAPKSPTQSLASPVTHTSPAIQKPPGKNPIASPHFKFPSRQIAGPAPKSDTIQTSHVQSQLGSGANRVRFDQLHTGPSATHLPRSVIESFVGWTEFATTDHESTHPASSTEEHQEAKQTPAMNKSRVQLDGVELRLDVAPDRSAKSLEPQVKNNTDSRFGAGRDPFGQAIRKPGQLLGEGTLPVQQSSFTSDKQLVLSPVQGSAEKRLSKSRRLPVVQQPSGSEEQVIPTAFATDRTAIEERSGRKSSPFPIESIPLFPEPAWPFVSDLLLGAGWPFISRLAEGMEKILTGRSSRIMVSGIQRAVGSTTLAVTLGRWAVATERRVLVVDADLQSAGLTRMIGRDPARSWPAVTRGKDFVTTGIVRSSRTGIAFATTGKIRNRQLWPPFSLNRLGELLDSIEGVFDLVIVDTGPVNQIVAELTSCDRLTTCAMVVSTGAASEEPMIQAAHQRLGALGAQRILSARNFSSTPLKKPG